MKKKKKNKKKPNKISQSNFIFYDRTSSSDINGSVFAIGLNPSLSIFFFPFSILSSPSFSLKIWSCRQLQVLCIPFQFLISVRDRKFGIHWRHSNWGTKRAIRFRIQLHAVQTGRWTVLLNVAFTIRFLVSFDNRPNWMVPALLAR